MRVTEHRRHRLAGLVGPGADPRAESTGGHTADRLVRYKPGDNSVNVCIDTHLRHYAVIEHEELTVKEVSPLTATTC